MAHASLQFAGLFLSYFLKIAVAYLLCWGLTRLLDNPRNRFRLWLAFLLGSGTYWAIVVFSSLPGFSTAGPAAALTAAGGASSAPHFFVPLTWYHAVSWAGKILFWIYCSGFAFFVATAVWKHWRLRRVLHSGAEPTPELERLFELLARDCGVRGCRLVILPALNSPATVYWLHPRILLPQSCASLEDVAQLADMLQHELEHIARRDYLWASVSDLLCGALFFHPAAWQARKHLRLQRELACDQAVVAARPEHRADYATTLAQFVRRHMLERRPSLGVDLASSASFVGMRIRAILSEPRSTPWWQKLSRVTASAGLIALFGVFCPALAVFVEFAPQLLPTATSSAQSQSDAAGARRRAAVHRAEQNVVVQPAGESLTSLRPKYVPETPVFQLSSAVNTSPEPVPLLRAEMPRSSTVTYPFPKPSVAGVLTAAGEIAAIVRGGHGPPRGGGNKPDSDDMH
jgi:beta-lactamase regulating signal transducer with metallopeptidase domain